MNSIIISYHLKLYNETEVIVGLLDNGLSHFHLRKNDMGLADYKKLIKEIPKEYHRRIVIHSHHELLDEFDLMGYYLSVADRSQVKVPEGNYVKSTFVNGFEELDQLDGKFDYFIMGPIFKSISRPNLTLKFNHDYLRTQFSQHHYQSKVLAIGGIKESTTEMAINYGFDGVVILGSVWALYMETLDIKQVINKYIRINTVSLVIKN